MATLTNCQFLKISAGGKEIEGYSEDDGYKNYIEGYSMGTLAGYKGLDGYDFEPVSARILVKSQPVAELFGSFLDTDTRSFDITIVHRTNSKNGSFEHKTCDYFNCTIESMSIVAMEDGNTFYDLSFSFKSMKVEFQIPQEGEGASPKKVGPFAYNLIKSKFE
ncbi:TPA: hypothetical protein M5879_002989 [Citrobacter koseri]|uniref:hypothetical protein n=1 Tax=Citrobacter koseri TaxID=545 RepID=UPI00388F522E|nr:hypothetical protein [Citrobacter koseri]